MSYSENKFFKLSEVRKAEVLLNLFYQLEASWIDSIQKQKIISELVQYFIYLGSINFQELKWMERFRGLIESKKFSLRQCLDMTIALERFLKISVKDDQIYSVASMDADRNYKREVSEDKEFYSCVILDHLRSAYNVGSIFRICEGMGIEKIFLVGYTPTPENEVVRKTAMGATEFLKWETYPYLSELLEFLKQKKFQIFALETSERAIPLEDVQIDKKFALLVGNERFGLDSQALAQSHQIVKIPMRGLKNSLNVASSLSICAYEFMKKYV